MAYRQDFRALGMTINENLNFSEWIDFYKKLVYWELSLEKLEDEGMHEILTVQKSEANVQFSKFIEKNYLNFFHHQLLLFDLAYQFVLKYYYKNF
jgi:hypothetical protein